MIWMLLLELKQNFTIRITGFIVGKVYVFQLSKTWKDFLDSLIMASRQSYHQNFYHRMYGPSFMQSPARRQNRQKWMKQKVPRCSPKKIRLHRQQLRQMVAEVGLN